MRAIDADALKRRAQKVAIESWKMKIETKVETVLNQFIDWIDEASTIQPEPKRGRWILDRSGAYCCSECMEPCAGYVMMKPRDKFCKMCGSRNEVTE